VAFLIDLSHTSHTRARTGIQRVSRGLLRDLGGGTLPICYDPYQRAWRGLAAWERANLAAQAPSRGRSARWPLGARFAGLLKRSRRPRSCLGEFSGALLVPEIFSPEVNAAWPALFENILGPRIAIFHDAIALKFPEFSSAGMAARFSGYMVELLAFDGIAATSQDSRTSLIKYWKWLGARNPPPVEALSLGIDPPTAEARVSLPSPPLKAPDSRPSILSVGTVEGRKNHGALLEACEGLWAAGRDFELRLIGLGHTQTGRAALDRIRRLQSVGRPLRYDGPADDPTLEAAYAACAFTVYPSLSEGFGMPVAESLLRGKPCVCLGTGALGEISQGGGCVPLAEVTAGALATAIGDLLAHPEELAALSAAASHRRFQNGVEYANKLAAWTATIARRDNPAFAFAKN